MLVAAQANDQCLYLRVHGWWLSVILRRLGSRPPRQHQKYKTGQDPNALVLHCDVLLCRRQRLAKYLLSDHARKAYGGRLVSSGQRLGVLRR